MEYELVGRGEVTIKVVNEVTDFHLHMTTEGNKTATYKQWQ